MLKMQPAIIEVRKGDYLISTNPSELDLETIHNFLSQQSFWAAGIPEEIVRTALENSLNFGLYLGVRQIGYATIVLLQVNEDFPLTPQFFKPVIIAPIW